MRTTKTAKASIIRIAPPIVEEPSESLEPLKELFEKEETAYRLSFTKSMETGIYASYRSIKECAFSNITFIDSAFKSAQISDVVFRQCDFHVHLAVVHQADHRFSRCDLHVRGKIR